MIIKLNSESSSKIVDFFSTIGLTIRNFFSAFINKIKSLSQASKNYNPKSYNDINAQELFRALLLIDDKFRFDDYHYHTSKTESDKTKYDNELIKRHMVNLRDLKEEKICKKLTKIRANAEKEGRDPDEAQQEYIEKRKAKIEEKNRTYLEDIKSKTKIRAETEGKTEEEIKLKIEEAITQAEEEIKDLCEGMLSAKVIPQAKLEAIEIKKNNIPGLAIRAAVREIRGGREMSECELQIMRRAKYR